MYLPLLNKYPKTFPVSGVIFILLRIFILLVFGIWIYGFLTPFLLNTGDTFLQFLFSRIYSTMCHQDAEKCITISNEHFLVCARCSGIYFGVFLTGLISLFWKRFEVNKKMFLIMSLPLLLDVLFNSVRFYHYSKFVAFTTGIIFGSYLILIIISELEDYLFIKKSLGK